MQDSLLNRIDALRVTHLDAIHAAIEKAANTLSPNSSLVAMTQYHMSTGGKRLRAILPLAVAEAMGGAPQELIPLGAACEILHNATLVHDDLQDGDTMRRGQETIWVKYGPAQAINLGDAMLYYTLHLVGELSGSAEVRERVSRRILRETVRVIDGQEREFALQQMDAPTIEDYIRMVEGKTSGLFALPIAGAADFCGADDDLITALNKASGHLGVIFQIQDDVLDLFGDKGRDRIGTDIAEGKITAMIVHTLENASNADSTWLRSLLRRDREDVGDPEISKAIELIRATGSLAYALEEIDRRKSAALQDGALKAHPALFSLLSDLIAVFLKPIGGI